MYPDLKQSDSDFIKFDEGKIEYHLFPIKSLAKITKVLMYGAKKYSPDNWRKCADNNRYYDAALRHLLAWKGGELKDPESGMPHLWHAACNLIFLVELE